MSRAQRFRTIALLGYLGIWLLLPVWYLWLAPSTGLPAYFLAFLMVPLVFPLRGMLRGYTYTYKWSLFLSLLYFLHGVGEAWTVPEERLYAGLEVVLSLCWFGGGIAYVRGRRNEG